MSENAPESAIPKYQPEVSPEVLQTPEGMRAELRRLANVRTNAARLYVEMCRQKGGAWAAVSAEDLCADGMNKGVIPTIVPDGLRSGMGTILLTGDVKAGHIEYFVGYPVGASETMELMASRLGSDGPHELPGITIENPGSPTHTMTGELLMDKAARVLPKLWEHTSSLEYIAGQLGEGVTSADLVATPPPPPPGDLVQG